MSQSEPEAWRPIPGFDGYEASDAGRVRSWKRQAGAGRRDEPRIKAQSPDKDGYMTVSVMQGGRQRTKRVGTLVLLAFKGPPPPGHEARHLNGAGADNAASNLEWSTHVVNISDKYKHGTMPRGDDHWSRRRPELRYRGERKNSKLDEGKVRGIRAAFADGESGPSIASRLGVDAALVYRVRDRKVWGHVE